LDLHDLDGRELRGGARVFDSGRARGALGLGEGAGWRAPDDGGDEPQIPRSTFHGATLEREPVDPKRQPPFDPNPPRRERLRASARPLGPFRCTTNPGSRAPGPQKDDRGFRRRSAYVLWGRDDGEPDLPVAL